MSYEEQEQDGTTGAEGDLGNEGVDDLTMALHGGGEANFISETKQPVSKGTMAVAGLLIACGAVTYFMYVRNGPTTAAADPGSLAAEATVNQFLQGGSTKTREWQDLIRSTDNVVKQFKREVPQVPLTQLAANPFQKGELKPSGDQEAMAKEKRKALITSRAKEAVNDLRLQTIIHPNPKRATCMINNALYRKGQKVSVGSEEKGDKIAFTVDDIRPDGVTVSVMAVDESLKFELKMKQ
jgi:hypothetical protein